MCYSFESARTTGKTWFLYLRLYGPLESWFLVPMEQCNADLKDISLFFGLGGIHIMCLAKAISLLGVWLELNPLRFDKSWKPGELIEEASKGGY